MKFSPQLKKQLGLIALFFLLAATLTLSRTNLSSSAEVIGKKDSIPTIGFIVPLSGPLAEFGTAIQNGVVLAAETNLRVKQTFRPVYEDSRYDSTAALASFEKLRSIDDVRIVYLFGGPMSEALSPVAETRRVPLFSTEYNPNLTRGRNYVIRFANTSNDFGKVLLSELRTRGLKRFAVVKCENQYHNTLFDAFRSELQPDEDLVSVDNHQVDERDFRTTIAKLRHEKIDALGIYLLPGMQNAFLRQLQAEGLNYPLFGTDSFETDSENAGVESVARGALYVNAAVNSDFRTRYLARFGNTSQIVHAAHAYEFALLVAELFDGTSLPTDPAELIGRFKSAIPRESVLGVYHFSNDPAVGNHFHFPLAAKHALASRKNLS